MRTLDSYLAETEGMSPRQIGKWFMELGVEEQRELEILGAFSIDSERPTPAVGAGQSSSLPGLDYYDRRSEPFLCIKPRKRLRVAGRNV
jgi:hypothetical protein